MNQPEFGSPAYYRQAYQHSSPIPRVANIFLNVTLYFLFVFLIPYYLIKLMGVLALIFPIIFIRRVYRPLFNSHVYPKVQKTIYKPDRRFRTGVRPIGSYMAEDTNIKVPLEKDEISYYRIEGFLKLAILITSCTYLFLELPPETFERDISMTERIKNLNKGDTLYRKGETFVYYSLIEKQGRTFQETAFDTTGTIALFNSLDSIQVNKDGRSAEERKDGPNHKYFKPRYEYYAEVLTFTKPVFKTNSKSLRRRRINKYWYLKLSDVDLKRH